MIIQATKGQPLYLKGLKGQLDGEATRDPVFIHVPGLQPRHVATATEVGDQVSLQTNVNSLAIVCKRVKMVMEALRKACMTC